MGHLKIRPINTGFVTTIPKEYLYHHSVTKFIKNISDKRIEMPVFVFLIEGGEKTVLIDTGMANSERASEYHHPYSRQPEGMAIHEQIKKIGYELDEIDIIIFTHLHWDHTFYMDKFTNAEYIAHEKEVEFAFNPIPLYFKSYEHPELGITRPFEGARFKTVKGETEIIEGIRVFETPGHSPGHISVEIDTKMGSYICAGDSVFIPDNLRPVPEMHYDITPPGRFYNIVETWNSIALQKKRAQDISHILCCHDAALIEKIKKNPIIGE